MVDDAGHVLSALFAEAERRDPTHARSWVTLVDGNNHQIDRLHAEAKARRVTLPILIDFIHVLEYLWRAAWSFHAEGDPHAETLGGGQGHGGPERARQHGGRSHPTQGHLPRPAGRFAISRGSRGASSLTPEPDRRFPGMLLSPSPFGSG